MINLDQIDTQYIRQCLLRDKNITHDLESPLSGIECRQAAVLLPLVRHQQQWHLLFIRRAEHEQDFHSGQVAFAGGKYEQLDVDLKATALREAEEEIGVRAEDVAILGKLGFHHSITGFKITPVVAHIPWPYQFILDQKEVARVFTIPLQWLADPDNHRVEQRRLTGGETFPVVYFEEYDGELLWGASARMTLSLLSLLEG